MPTSKKRKRAGKVVKRQPVVTMPDLSKSWTLKIKASQMHYLKTDPDFLMMVKMGRMLNALLFAMTSVAQFIKNDSYLATRQYRRGLFILAGYLHESIMVLKATEQRHLIMDSFVPLRKIVFNPEYKKTREYLRVIRNVAGFHLADSAEHDNTKNALSDIDLSAYVLMGADDDKDFVSYYFEFTDILDMAAISGHFPDERDPRDVAHEIHDTVHKVAQEFITAATHFQVALCKKMELGEYVYGSKLSPTHRPAATPTAEPADPPPSTEDS